MKRISVSLLLLVWGATAAPWSSSRSTTQVKRVLSRRLQTYGEHPIHLHYRFVIPRGGSSTEEEEEAVAEEGEQAVAATTTEEETESSVATEETQDDREDDDEEAIDILEEATLLRQTGKELHDDGDWFLAAQVFSQAADLLEGASSSNDDDDDDYLTDACTCRLHEALCRLKMEDFDSCIAVCTTLLEDSTLPAAAIRARALLRRAKAHLGLGHDEQALSDARQAAFLGDRKAVALYGTLMRGSNTEEQQEEMPPMLNDLIAGKNPFLGGTPSSESSSSSLLQSLLSKSAASGSSPNLGVSGDAPSLLGQGGAGASLAKSLLSSLTKRLEDDSDSICEYLQKTNPTQIQTLGSMAGVVITERQATQLVKFCHKLTPKTMRRTVQYSKRAWYGITLMRKTAKVINKYKHLLILWALAAWIQAAIRRPIPISKKAARAAAELAAARRSIPHIGP